MKKPRTNCYLCGKPDDGNFTRDHIPPKGLFLEPRPNNLITVPCCFKCNNEHSSFDERLRIIASIPFDRNEVGQRILDEKVIGSTFARKNQMQFVEKLATSMRVVSERPELTHLRIDGREFKDGMIQITKGLLSALHPNIEYHKSTFVALSISPQSSDKQSEIMIQLMRGRFLERGQGVFQCWRHVEESREVQVWMLVLYGCFGFFIYHTNKPEFHKLFEVVNSLKRVR